MLFKTEPDGALSGQNLMNFKILTGLTQHLLFPRVSFPLNCFTRSSNFFSVFWFVAMVSLYLP